MDVKGLIDYHTHTAVTIDSNSTVDECCRRASELGLAEIAFTNHIILGNSDYCMSLSGLMDLWEQIQICQQNYPELKLRLGAEMDYFEGREEEISVIIHSYESNIGQPFDFVMGAVHYLRGIFFSSDIYAPNLFLRQRIDDPVDKNNFLEVLYSEYFDLVSKAIRSGLFDVIAHIDLIRKFTDDLSPRLSFENYRDSAEKVVQALIESRVGVEINTKGLTRKLKELYPSDKLLSLYIERAKERHVEPIITLGSDSHQAKNVGALLEEGTRALLRAGGTVLTGFNQRKQYPIQIHQIQN
jgi:histidinol-phosphatase (PHP family)